MTIFSDNIEQFGVYWRVKVKFSLIFQHKNEFLIQNPQVFLKGIIENFRKEMICNYDKLSPRKNLVKEIDMLATNCTSLRLLCKIKIELFY